MMMKLDELLARLGRVHEDVREFDVAGIDVLGLADDLARRLRLAVEAMRKLETATRCERVGEGVREWNASGERAARSLFEALRKIEKGE